MRNAELPDKHIERVLAAKAILDNNPGKKIGIKELAHEVGWNRTELANAFKLLLELTIKDYQLELKMKTAQHLLETTQNPVKRVALLSGYKSDSNFAVAFKREIGLTPVDYRRKVHNGHNVNKPSKKRTKRK
jgi:two-component system response regulator YesN